MSEDFNDHIKKAQQNKQSFTISPPNLKEQEEAKIIEEQERQDEERLRHESEAELLQEETTPPTTWDQKGKWAFLTLGYIGHSPKAPGSMGSLVATLMGLPILYYVQASNLMLLSILIAAIAVKVIDEYEAQGGLHDDKRIVIDELVGMWIALCMVGFGVLQTVLAFVFFRLFDIWKPSVIGRVDKNLKGGLGVVLDDALAGFFAGLLGLMVIGVLQQLGVEIAGVFEMPDYISYE